MSNYSAEFRTGVCFSDVLVAGHERRSGCVVVVIDKGSLIKDICVFVVLRKDFIVFDFLFYFKLFIILNQYVYFL